MSAQKRLKPAHAVIIVALVAAAVLAVYGLTTAQKNKDSNKPEQVSAASRLVSDGSVVLADADGTGRDVSAAFFDSSETVVVSSAELKDQLTAAAIAMDTSAPMLVRYPEADAAVDEEIERLGAQRVINVGEGAGPEDDREDVDLISETDAIAAEEDNVIAQIAERNSSTLDDTPVLVTEATSAAAAATASAANVPLTVLPYPDPRASSETMEQVKGTDTLALGQQFGSTDYFRGAVELAANGEVPGGGGLIFPGRRMIALYGHPSGDALGQMGEQPPAEAVDVVKNWVSQYEPFSEEPIIPAFEVIATVASQEPGPDGNFTNETDPAELEPYIDAITEAGGYAVIDLQPGLGTFKDQALLYEDLLKRPNVGLALDAEWKLEPGQTPAAQVGSANAAEINDATAWLAQLTRENNLPQKALIVHQFQVAMLPDRENIITDHPELSFILHADGHGTPEQKFDTWNVLKEDLDPAFFVAWKNFIDEDQPMFTPEQTYTTVEPKPWFVSYQ